MMKKMILLLLAAVCGLATAAAQDLIVKTDASKIEAKVVEIAPDVVRYKRFSNLDGPTYVLPVAEIRYIQYANGEKELFGKPDEQLVTISIADSTPEPASRPDVQYVVKQYEIGEIYDRDGVKGIVCQLSEDGTHGLLLSVDEIYLPWSTFRKPDLRVSGMDERLDGRANMEKVAAYIAQNNLTWDDFPAFKWCRDKGEGWYLPSIDELLTIGHNYNGGSRMTSNRVVRNKFNDTLKSVGGERMDRLVYYFSSTEMDQKNAYTTHMGIEPPYVVEIPKYNKFLVRAVRRF